ncbi:MAG: DinB family protein, partial [Acidobacteria bacterium]|nr:DinB family protein [Acidobacteriota bacterium]
MTAKLPEPWLRGPLPAIPAGLQPAAHALVMSIEDCEAAAAGLSPEQLWHEPGGAASVGFHLRHLAGSTDRLLTYARGEPLSSAQKVALAVEATPGEPRPTAAELLRAWRTAVDRALGQLAATPDAALMDARGVGRAQLPSSVLGLLFHAAEHASRHTGQVVTTA